jgi:hypothetical protein
VSSHDADELAGERAGLVVDLPFLQLAVQCPQSRTLSEVGLEDRRQRQSPALTAGLMRASARTPVRS